MKTVLKTTKKLCELRDQLYVYVHPAHAEPLFLPRNTPERFEEGRLRGYELLGKLTPNKQAVETAGGVIPLWFVHSLYVLGDDEEVYRLIDGTFEAVVLIRKGGSSLKLHRTRSAAVLHELLLTRNAPTLSFRTTTSPAGATFA